jgi:NhaP-type Na+/H+ or K+/H+ antiporter
VLVVFGIIRVAVGFLVWQICWAAALLAGVVITATQPSWSTQSKPSGQTDEEWRNFIFPKSFL